MRDDLAPAQWVKSTHSTNEGECVEVAGLHGGRAVRDSKDPDGTRLSFTAAQWSAFTAAAGDGQFD
jgi:hypothetical protein